MSRTTRSILVLIVLLAIITGLAATGVVSARQESVATLLVTAGSVTLTPIEGDAQEYPMDEAVLVNVGDLIAVSEDGEAYLTFFEGAETRLAAGSTAEVQEFTVEGDKTEVGLSLTLGQAASSVETMMGAESRFEVNTPAATITVRGTQFIVFVRPNQLTQVASLDGTVDVSALDKIVELPPGFGVRVVPGEAPGTVNVWGQAVLKIAAPEDADAENLPVTWVNTENSQIYRYRSEDVMAMVVGPYELTVNVPGPFVLPDIVYPPADEPQEPQEFEVALGALALNVIESDPDITDHVLLVTFSQGELVGQTVTAASGDALLAAPGTWTVGVSLEANPDILQAYEVTIEAGEIVALDVDANALREE